MRRRAHLALGRDDQRVDPGQRRVLLQPHLVQRDERVGDAVDVFGFVSVRAGGFVGIVLEKLLGGALGASSVFADKRADIEQEVDILAAAGAVLDTGEHLGHPPRAFATRRTLAARLVMEELLGAQGEPHGAVRIVRDDHRTRSEGAARGHHRVDVGAQIEVVGRREKRWRRPQHDDLGLAAICNAAGHLDKLAKRRAHGQLIVARVCHIAAD